MLKCEECGWIDNEDELFTKEESCDEVFCPKCGYRIETETLSIEDEDMLEEDENIFTNCRGTGKIIVNEDGQSMTEARPIYIFHRTGKRLVLSVRVPVNTLE